MILATVVVLVVVALAVVIRSNPFFYCGYCQHKRSDTWIPGNTYPCDYWTYLTTSNSSDITLYMNEPAP
jgi:hypothetical protein